MTNASVIMYADDTVIYFAHENVCKIEDALNDDLVKISEYFHKTELVVNLKQGKTEVMLFGSAKRYKMHGRDLKIFYQGKEINDLPTICGLVNRHICLLVKKCITNDFENETFDNYFTIMNHSKKY